MPQQARCTSLPGNPPRKPDNLLAKSHEDPRNTTEHRASTDSSSTSRAIPQCSRGKEQRITAHKSFVKLLTQKRAGSGIIARESCGRDGLETHDGPKHPELVQHQTQSIVPESNIVAGAVCRSSPPSTCRTIFSRKPWGQNHRNLPEESSSTLELCEHDCTTYALDLYLCDNGKEVCIHFNSQPNLSTESAQEKAPTTRPPRYIIERRQPINRHPS